VGDISAVTLTSVTKTVFGNKRIAMFDMVVGDGLSTFPAAGISLTPAQLGMTTVEFLTCESASLTYKYDYANQVLKAYTLISGASGLGVTANASGAPILGTSGTAFLFGPATLATPKETVRITAIGTGLA